MAWTRRFWYRDVVDLLEQAGERLDQIMIPKVGCAADVYAVDALVTACERAKGRKKRISLEVIIESAAGIAHVEEIAAASPRLQAMSLGAADFAASMGMQTTGIGGTQENYYMLREGPKLVRPLALGAGRHRRRLPHPWGAAGGRAVRRFQR
jgi:malyl-CoA/(S)-citramalyl-CoA lyase